MDPVQSSQVFLNPEELVFFADDPSKHRVVLTVMNPYEFPVSFHILCREVDKYLVGAQRGTIKPKHRFDLVIRHNDVRACYFYRPDLFKIELYRKNKSKPFAERQFTAVVKPSSLEGQAMHLVSEPPAYNPPAELPAQVPDKPQAPSGNVGLFLMLCALLVLVLVWPMECVSDNIDWWPPFLRVNVHVKLLLSFVIGVAVLPLWRDLQ